MKLQLSNPTGLVSFRQILALLLAAATTAVTAAPDPALVPANDAFTNRIALTGATNAVTASSVGATKENGEPNHARDTGGASVWWSWTAPASGPVMISSAGSDFDTLLAVYTGTNVAALTRIVQDDDFRGARTSQVGFQAIGGIEYEIVMDGWQGATGNISLNVSQPTPVPPTILNQPQSSTNNVGDSVQFSVLASGVPPLSFRWFKDGVAVPDGGWRPTLFIEFVQTNDAGAYSVLVSDRFGSVTSTVAVLTVNPPPPPPPPPANDSFTNRVALIGATNTVTSSNAGATKETGEPNHADETGGASVWWSWTAPASGRVTVSLAGSDFDTLLAVYTGTNVDGLTLIAQDDDTREARTSQVGFLAVAGTEYEIAVDGWEGATGNISLSITQTTPVPPTILTQPRSVTNNVGDTIQFSVVAAGAPPLSYQWFKDGVALPHTEWRPNLVIPFAQTNDLGAYNVLVSDRLGSVTSSVALLTLNPPPPPPANDNFANRTALTAATNSVTASNNSATNEPGEPRHAREFGGSSVWWSWTAPASGLVKVSTAGSSFDTLLGVYVGTNVASLIPVASNDDNGTNATSQLLFNAVVGIEYEIAVDGWHGAIGNIVLSITQSTPSPLAPVILTQPQSVKILLTNRLATAAASFTVIATDAMNYQWRLNSTALPGATNSILTLTNARPYNSGFYSVLVGNDYGTVLSTNALLRVLAGRQLGHPTRWGHEGFSLPFDAQPGDLPDAPPQVTVQVTTNFVNWVTLTNGYCLTNGQFMILDPSGTNQAQRFYRVLDR